MTISHSQTEAEVRWADRFAAALVEQYSSEKVFDVALQTQEEAESVSGSLRAMGYSAEILPPGDRVRVTCP
jgi:hypothetical protein